MVIDRFEGDFAVIEMPDGKLEKMPRALIPLGAREGDVLVIALDKRETEKRRENIKEKMNKLFKD